MTQVKLAWVKLTGVKFGSGQVDSVKFGSDQDWIGPSLGWVNIDLGQVVADSAMAFN